MTGSSVGTAGAHFLPDLSSAVSAGTNLMRLHSFRWPMATQLGRPNANVIRSSHDAVVVISWHDLIHDRPPHPPT